MAFLLVIVLVFIIFLVRIAYIMMEGKEGAKDYDDPVVAEDVIRGTIRDSEGRILASQVSQWALYFRLTRIDDMEALAQLVSPYIGMSVDEILTQVSSYNTYALVRRRIDASTASALQAAIDEAGVQDQVVLEKQSVRSYPSLFHAAQLIGFTNAEGVGSEGIEYSYDDILSPYPGLDEEVTYGDDISLTLDLDVQYLVDVQVQEVAIEHSPSYIMAMVADARTGDVLAASSWPWYDLNWYNLSTDEERLNRNVAFSYEPGSVFKVFTLAAAMEEGVDTDTIFYCDGSEDFTVGGSTFTINCHSPHGQVDARQMISKSCNGAIASWVLQLSDETFLSYLNDFGFGVRPDIELGAVSAGWIAPAGSWSNRTKATMAFGQELNVTAFQVVQAATAIANSGMLMPLQVVDRIVDHDGAVVEDPQSQGHQVISPATASAILSYMETAVQEGTARKAAVNGVRVAAKTGTAQLINEETGSYEDGPTLASTLAIVPADEPRYIVYFAVCAPTGSTIWGEDIAAPAAGNVIRGLVSQGRLHSADQRTIQLN